ncbi:hypothetical protein SDC9_199799 [bioreactor metagenome]|uniref:Uncharacterized protein n=1 Tax=bioreactor metagenome TaxID=1076179 RepID=A0A645ILF0_9ZZZZ
MGLGANLGQLLIDRFKLPDDLIFMIKGFDDLNAGYALFNLGVQLTQPGLLVFKQQPGLARNGFGQEKN